MSAAELLEEIQHRSPDIIGIILTGQTEFSSAVDAVNKGKTFRFLTKPCQPEIIAQAVLDAIRQYRLVNAERVLLQDTLKGAITLLSELIGLGIR